MISLSLLVHTGGISDVDLSRTSISVVCVVDDCSPDSGTLALLMNQLAERFSDVEIVLVANGSRDEVGVALKALTNTLPDIAVEFLEDRVDRDAAMLTGIENAIGDWILLLEPTTQLVTALPQLIAEAVKGFDVVLAVPMQAPMQKGLQSSLERAFVVFYNWLGGGTALAQRPAASILSRSAALYVLRSVEGEMLLRSARIASGFPSAIVTIAEAGFARPSSRLVASFGKAMRLLLASSSAPLRFISIVGCLGSAVAFAYSVYVVLVYLFKGDVQPGWATLSLQLAFLTFVISVMFALLSEYIVQIHSASFARRRHVVSREIRSQLSRRSRGLNVVDTNGRYRLGAPEGLESAHAPADRVS
jgi:polyisoprenyl-phosphate glycosyltransferase